MYYVTQHVTGHSYLGISKWNNVSMWNYVLALKKTANICMHKHIEHAVLKEGIEYLM